ncbi:MAG: cupin domain-containing protein [Xanthobacteraceae bacterium]
MGDQQVRATPGTYVFIPPAVPHNIANAYDEPSRVLMTVSPHGHEHYFEELARVVACGRAPDPNVIAELRSRFDTVQLSTLKIS